MWLFLQDINEFIQQEVQKLMGILSKSMTKNQLYYNLDKVGSDFVCSCPNDSG